MQHSPPVRTGVLNNKLGRGIIIKKRRFGTDGAIIVVRFCDANHVTVTFAADDFDTFLTVLPPEKVVIDPNFNQLSRPRDPNKARLKELEQKIATKKKPPR